MGLTWKPFTAPNIKDTLTPGLQAFFDKAGIATAITKDLRQSTADFKARQALGLQLLDFVNNGSSQETVIPPIRHGILRGSGSVFVDGVLVGDTKSSYPDGAPNETYQAKKGDVTIGYNTAYAARWHENPFTPGGKIPSKQAKANPGMLVNVGYKYVERHLRADGVTLWRFYAEKFKQYMGMK